MLAALGERYRAREAGKDRDIERLERDVDKKRPRNCEPLSEMRRVSWGSKAVPLEATSESHSARYARQEVARVSSRDRAAGRGTSAIAYD